MKDILISLAMLLTYALCALVVWQVLTLTPKEVFTWLGWFIATPVLFILLAIVVERCLTIYSRMRS